MAWMVAYLLQPWSKKRLTPEMLLRGTSSAAPIPREQRMAQWAELERRLKESGEWTNEGSDDGA